MASNLKAYEIRFRNTPREKVRTVTQFHESAEDAIYEGMRSIRQYEARAVFVTVCETQDPHDTRGDAGLIPDGKFYVRDESGEWEQI